MNRCKVSLLRAVAAIVGVVGSISLLRTTAAQGTDFAVFWSAVQNVLAQQPVYSTVRDGGMVFKYPPWIVPFFIPFGLLSLDLAKWAWGFLELVSLYYVVYWIRTRLRVPSRIWFPVLVSYWGLWIVHALDGQISLIMLAIALGFWDNPESSKTKIHSLRKDLRFAALFLALSTKIFTLVPLFDFLWNRPMSLRHSTSRLRTGSLIGLMIFVLSLPVVLASPSIQSTLVSWMDAAGSAGRLLTSEQVRGRYNPGLPSYLMKTLGVPAHRTDADLVTAAFLALGLGGLWSWMSRRYQLSSRERWLGWLALTPVVHPLPWWHLFVFSFPGVVWTVNQVVHRNSHLLAKFFCFLGLFLICFSTEKLWGSFGLVLESNAAKSWGVLCCLLTLLSVKRKQSQISLEQSFSTPSELRANFSLEQP